MTVLSYRYNGFTNKQTTQKNKMLSRKKQLYKHKIERALKRYNAVLIYQHSGLTTERWKQLRELLAQMPRSSSTLSCQNLDISSSTEAGGAVVMSIRDKIARISENLQLLPDDCSSDTDTRCHPSWGQQHKTGKQETTTFAGETVYQGPVLLIGCNSHRAMVSAHSLLVKQGKRVLLLGGSYYQAKLNHKDLSHLLTLNTSVYTSLLDVVESSSKSFTHYLVASQHNLVAVIKNI